jgi:hypothetical protein
MTRVRPSPSRTRGSPEPPPVRVRRRRTRRARVLPATGRRPRPPGQHAGGHVQHGITQRCVDHLLPRQALRVAHTVHQVRIELTRSRCGAVPPDSSARAARTPPRPPPARAAGARTAIGLIFALLIMHSELPFCARVDSRHRCLPGYDGSKEKTSQEIGFEHHASECSVDAHVWGPSGGSSA